MPKSETTKIFAERLSDLIADKNISLGKLEQMTGISKSALSKYTNDEAEAPITSIVKLAQYFDISADYLLGLSDARTADKDLQFVCDYTGLSAESIEKLRNYCIPDFSSIDASNTCEEDKQYEMKEMQEYRRILNNFILSNAFDSVVSHGWQVNHLNIAVVSFLAIYFGDYEYFFKLHEEENTVKNIQFFLNEFENDYVHNAFTDRMDMFSFQLQKAMLNYADELFIFNKFEDSILQRVFEWIQYVVWSSVHPVYKENGNIDKIQENIKQFKHEVYVDKIPKLKTIYEELKKGGINGGNTKA